jgi:hypothetical protein
MDAARIPEAAPRDDLSGEDFERRPNVAGKPGISLCQTAAPRLIYQGVVVIAY